MTEPSKEALEAVIERRGEFREIGWAEPQHDYDRAKSNWDAQTRSDALALDAFAQQARDAALLVAEEICEEIAERGKQESASDSARRCKQAIHERRTNG